MAEDTTLPEEWQNLCVSLPIPRSVSPCRTHSLLLLDSSSPKIPEFKVWVTMGGKVLTSHKKDTLEHANVGAEIAGIEGREFKVSFAIFLLRSRVPIESELIGA